MTDTIVSRSPIYHARKRAGLSRRVVAKRLKVTTEYVEAIEHRQGKGVLRPSLDLARRLSRVLGVAIDELFPEELTPLPPRVSRWGMDDNGR